MIMKKSSKKNSKSQDVQVYQAPHEVETTQHVSDEFNEENEGNIEDDLEAGPAEEELENDSLLPTLKSEFPVKVITENVKVNDQYHSLKTYLQSITRYKLLTPEEEKKLTTLLHETGDVEVAKKLVLANLRLVVKIAMEYKHSYQNVLDLIQEGNFGLMKAVSKYNPNSGAKLSYYASWWIRSFILKFILDNFRLVKIGTTQEQKKLFYNLMREKERLMNQGISPDPKLIAQALHVSERSVIEMDQRLGSAGGEVSIDRHHFEEGGPDFHDILPSDQEDIADQLAFGQGLDILKSHLKDFLNELKPRDREIFEKRLLSEVPDSLQAIADQYGVSRERIRQVEVRLMDKLKVYMSEYLR